MSAKTIVLALFATTASLFAQSAVLRGEIADGRATGCYYCPGYQFVLKWVGTRLESTTVNLAQFEVLSQIVEMTGTWDGTIFHVTAAHNITSMFDLTGNGSLGGRFRCDAVGNPGDLAVNAISLGTSFMIPVPNTPTLLQPSTTVVMGIGITGANGEFRSDINIPQNPALVGLRINGQAIFAPLNNGALYSSNLDTKVVQ
jgi:hypothetical protein